MLPEEVSFEELEQSAPNYRDLLTTSAPFTVVEVIDPNEDEGNRRERVLICEDGTFALNNFMFRSCTLPFSVLIDAGVLDEEVRDRILEERARKDQAAGVEKVLRDAVEEADRNWSKAKKAANELPAGTMHEVIEGLYQKLQDAKKEYKEGTGEEFEEDIPF